MERRIIYQRVFRRVTLITSAQPWLDALTRGSNCGTICFGSVADSGCSVSLETIFVRARYCCRYCLHCHVTLLCHMRGTLHYGAALPTEQEAEQRESAII